jgi:hypothetical protein
MKTKKHPFSVHMNRKFRRLFLAGTVLVLGGLTACSSGHWKFKKEYFDIIVRNARQRSQPGGMISRVRLDNVKNPRLMRPLRPEEEKGPPLLEGMVWFQQLEEEKVKVVIQTWSKKRGRHYGFAFADDILKPEPAGDGRWVLDVPGPLRFTKPDYKLDEHWWKVFAEEQS